MTEKNIHELVRDDILAREKIGDAEYGKPMRAFDGRNSLQDAYEESLDMAAYLRKAIEEQKKADAALEQLQETLGGAFGTKVRERNVWDRIEDVPRGVSVAPSSSDLVYRIDSSGNVALQVEGGKWVPSVEYEFDRSFNLERGPFTRVE